MDPALERFRLGEEYAESEACKLFARMKVMDLSYHVFLKNHDEWQLCINSRRPGKASEANERMAPVMDGEYAVASDSEYPAQRSPQPAPPIRLAHYQKM